MTGIVGVVAGSLGQQLWGVVMGIPDLLVYGAGAVLVLLVLKLLWSSATPRRRTPTTTRQPSTVTQQSTSATTDSTAASSNPSSSTTDQQHTRSDITEESEAASENGSTTNEDQSPTPEASTSEDVMKKRTPSQQETSSLDAVRSTEQTRPSVEDPASIGSASDRTRPQRQLRSNSNHRQSTQSQRRPQWFEAVNVDTGVQPLDVDTTWSLLKVDLSVDGASVDTAGELVYFDPLPPIVGRDFTPSPVDISSPSLLRLLRRTAASHAPSQSPTDDAEGTRRERTKSQHADTREPRRSQSSQPESQEVSSSRPARRETPHEHRISAGDDLFEARSDLASTPLPVHDSADSFFDTTDGLADIPDQAAASQPANPTATPVHLATDIPTVDDSTGDTTLMEESDTTASTDAHRPQQEHRQDLQVGAAYEYSPPQWDPPQVDPPTFERGDKRSQGGRDGALAEPVIDPVDPVAEMERGLALIGVDGFQIEDDSPGMDPLLEEEPPGGDGLFGAGEQSSWFDSSPLLPESSFNADPEPLLPGFDEMEGTGLDEEFRF